MENTQSVSDNDTPIYSKNDLLEIRKVVQEYINENEELQAKMIAMDSFYKKSEASLKKAKMYISQLEYTLAHEIKPSDN